jgi:hypothetical protein
MGLQQAGKYFIGSCSLISHPFLFEYVQGKWSYFVHWKGYGSDEDMWIDEDDAGGAEELIKEWHEKNDMPRDGKGKKRPVPRKSRGNSATATKDKKRKASSVDGMEVDSPEVEEPPAKKTAKRDARSSKASQESEPEEAEPEAELELDGEEQIDFALMDEYMTKARWVCLYLLRIIASC